MELGAFGCFLRVLRSVDVDKQAEAEAMNSLIADTALRLGGGSGILALSCSAPSLLLFKERYFYVTGFGLTGPKLEAKAMGTKACR